MFEFIGVTWGGGGCKGEGVSVPPIFCITENNFGGYRVEKEQIEK
jgi:hypothetical protein